MKLLEIWVQTPLAAALGWTLLHSLWEGAIVSAFLFAVTAMTKSPRARYAAASIAMLALLGGIGVTLVRVMPQSADGLRTVTTRVVPGSNVQAGVNASPGPGLAAAVPWLAPFWIAGVWTFYIVQMAGWISVWRLRRRGVCHAAERWQTELIRLRARLRLTRPVALLESCLAETPMVLGHFRPLILMPVGLLSGLPAGQIEAILLHELAHIRRWDYLTNILQRLVEGLLFYHPAVWWISWVMRAERENCCDDVVVSVHGDAYEYAVALAALEHNRWPGREAAVAATGGSLVNRIRRMLYPERPGSVWAPMLSALVLVATMAVTLGAWQSEPRPQDSSPYFKWLNEEVVYIISSPERAAFEGLATDEERDKFIEQFWLNRDPTPGTDKNEFREEHYRRIAFANERFKPRSDKAGWQTDRGRIYIIYGPPDEIERHPDGDARYSVPIESWRYRHIEGIGNSVTCMFIDPARTGDYRMTRENEKVQ